LQSAQQAAVRRGPLRIRREPVAHLGCHHSLRKCVCHQRVKTAFGFAATALEEENPNLRPMRGGARKGRSAGQRLITFVKHQTDPELQMRQTNSTLKRFLAKRSTKSACGKRGYQTVTLTYHKLVSCAPALPQTRSNCEVPPRNVLITVTVTQKLKGQKCIKAKKVDKKATSCPDPIISTRCVRHTIKERSTVSYQLKSERCRRKKQVSKKKIKCKGTVQRSPGQSVTKRCNQKVTKVTRYIRKLRVPKEN
uniref:Ig-like domain-containing protein n=1 Tax=Macrostomum lignano TaxID=282301 RepID=A0A1I8FGY3_9PLAT